MNNDQTTRTIEAFSHQVHWLNGSINTIIYCHKQNNSGLTRKQIN